MSFVIKELILASKLFAMETYKVEENVVFVDGIYTSTQYQFPLNDYTNEFAKKMAAAFEAELRASTVVMPN